MSSKRRIGLRLVQASPLVCIALVVLLFAVFPAAVSVQLLSQPLGTSDLYARRVRATTIDVLDQAKLYKELGLEKHQQTVYDANLATYESLIDRQAAILATPTGDTFAVSADDPLWSSLADVEDRLGADAWVWMLSMPERPALVASATVSARRMAAWREQMRLSTENEPDRIPSPPPTEENYLFWEGQLPDGKLQPVREEMFNVGVGGGGGGDDFWTASATIARGGKLWHVMAISPTPENPETVGELIDPDTLTQLDPTAPDSDERTMAAAKEADSNLYVFGPIEPKLTPVRGPEGKTPGDARRAAAAFFPWWYAEESMPFGNVKYLPADKRGAIGGTAAAAYVLDRYILGSGTTYSGDEIAPQSIAILYVFPDVEAPSPTGLIARFRSVQTFLAAWYPAVVGFAFALLAVSLVASGSAFVYERRLSARERLADDLARMRRDAHDKVYNRLSALSKRVSAAGDVLETRSCESLAAIAEDIRGTVGEIQQILGDEGRHTDSGLTEIALHDQVTAVCSAQAARLDVSVDCEDTGDLPDAPAALGWDLQCITEEAITNAVRHGGARRVRVELATTESGVLTLTVTDDGTGTAVRSSADASVDSTGLRGMTSRAERWNGTLTLAPASDGGTTLIATFDLGTG